METIKPQIWENCYDSSWKGIITPESFGHPAKFSRGLTERIYAHCLERGYVKKGDLVGDFFGGIGTGGIVASYLGLRWFGVELEPRFVAWALDNFGLHRSRWAGIQCPHPKIMQGDSRYFSTICDLAFSSPPYADSTRGNNTCGVDWSKAAPTKKTSGRHQAPGVSVSTEYGTTPGNIGNLKAGEIDAAITSPPFTQTPGGAKGINVNGYNGRSDIKPDYLGSRTYQGRGGDRVVGNIEVLKSGTVDAAISSPPYAGISTGAGGLNTKPPKHAGQQSGRSAKAASQDTDQKYGKTEGQISRLTGGSVDACVSSPPWERNCEGGRRASRMGGEKQILGARRGNGASDEAVLAQAARDEQKTYGDSPGQIGKEKGETYWEAMSLVYQSGFMAIKSGGVIVLVLKDYVKKRKRVTLCDDTCRLLEHIGFTVIERIHAMLVKESTEAGLDGSDITTTRSRKSFFRRLAEQKGSPKIDFEEVIIARRP